MAEIRCTYPHAASHLMRVDSVVEHGPQHGAYVQDKACLVHTAVDGGPRDQYTPVQRDTYNSTPHFSKTQKSPPTE